MIQGHLRQFEGQMSQNMIIQQIKTVTDVIRPIYGIILMIEGHFKVKKINFKVTIKEYVFNKYK